MGNVSKQMALLKFKDALEALADEDIRCSVVFAPDIVRDTGISEREGKNLFQELNEINSGVKKDRLRGFINFMRGGGHALLGVNAAIALRGRDDAMDVSLFAKVYKKDKAELVKQYLNENPKERDIDPPNTKFVIVDKKNPKQQGVNILLPDTIVVGEQPVLRLNDYSKTKRARVLKLLKSADVAAILSLKSPFMTELLELSKKGELDAPELLSDCTSGDMKTNYEMLGNMRQKGASGASTIRLLSINETEAKLFEMLLRREDGKREIIDAEERKSKLTAELKKENAKKKPSKDVIDTISNKIKETGEFILKDQMSNPFEAAHILYEKTGVPLLLHTSEGSCIISGEESTAFVPAADIKFPSNASYVGAGDTLCGAFATALAVKKKSDGILPENKRLGYEDCLVIANLATGYRLAKINEEPPKGVERTAWYEATGTIKEIYDWACITNLKRAVEKQELPDEIKFMDVEGNSAGFGALECMNSDALVKTVIENCETDYAVARVAFEELSKPPHFSHLSQLVTAQGSAADLFAERAVLVLVNRGGKGIDALADAFESLDEKTVFDLTSCIVTQQKEPAVTAEVLFKLLSKGRLADIYSLRSLITLAKLWAVDSVEIAGCKDSSVPIREHIRKLFRRNPRYLAMDKGYLVGGMPSELEQHLSRQAKKAASRAVPYTLENIVAQLPERAGLSDKDWKLLEAAVRLTCMEVGLCWKVPVSRTGTVPEIKGGFEELGIPASVLNNALIVMFTKERTPWALELLTPPYSDIVKKCLMWCATKTKGDELGKVIPQDLDRVNAYILADEILLNHFKGDEEVKKLYETVVLPMAMIEDVVNRMISTPFDDKNEDRLGDVLKKQYSSRVQKIKQALSDWPVKSTLKKDEDELVAASEADMGRLGRKLRKKQATGLNSSDVPKRKGKIRNPR